MTKKFCETNKQEWSRRFRLKTLSHQQAGTSISFKNVVETQEADLQRVK